MHCTVRLTSASQPEWLTKALSMHPSSSVRILESELTKIFSSPASELILAPSIPLPILIFGTDTHLPIIKGTITRIDSQKDIVWVTLHDTTKKALGSAYAHFLRTWPMRCVKNSMKQTFQKKFIDMANTTQWEFRCETIQSAIPSGHGDLPKHYENYLPQELGEMLDGVIRQIKSLFFVGISTKIPWSTIWDIPFLVPEDEIREYLPGGINGSLKGNFKQLQGKENKKMDGPENPGHHSTTLVLPTPSPDMVTLAPNHRMMTRNRNKRQLSPIDEAPRKQTKFLRSANVSQNARGGKIRYPSISHESPNQQDAKGIQPTGVKTRSSNPKPSD